MGAFACTAELDGRIAEEASAAIESETLVVSGAEIGRVEISFADIMDLRLLNYRLNVHLRDGIAVISKLGHQTEEFFERLWEAYSAMSERSLFVEGAPIMVCEGDYSYEEPDAQAQSIAKLALYPDCLCIVPHDVGARRVPLCFSSEPVREGFALGLALDTGERYRIARLGGNTDPFFKRLAERRDAVIASWKAAHEELVRNLPDRLGDASEAFESFGALAPEMRCGLFSSEDDAFWFAAVAPGRAAVELVTDEQTATYLYRFDTSPDAFVSSLRHAMEAVKTNRRIIFLAEDELELNALYRMAVDRSPHVRFLRACNAGRVIHTASWADKLREFFAG